MRAAVDPLAPTAAKRVLLVDDDFAILDGLAEFLETEGFSVLSASNGIDALSHLRSGVRVDVIVLDLAMPLMNGWDFRAEQLWDPDLRNIPVIVISAAAFSPQTLRQFRAEHALPKPLDLERFLRTLKDVCARVDSGSTTPPEGTPPAP